MILDTLFYFVAATWAATILFPLVSALGMLAIVVTDVELGGGK